MKILKHGSLFKKIGEKTCPECGCVFVYLEKDVYGSYDLERKLAIECVECPECECEMRVR